MSDATKAQETLQRVKRIETRLVTLGQKLGVDLVDAENGVHVFLSASEWGRCVVLDTLDVPISTIGKVCRRAKQFGRIPVYFDGAHIATMEVKQ